jgi:Tfp pilus assembly protein PilF
MKGGAAVQAKGKHDRETFVRVFFSLFRNRRSGILEITFGKKCRQLYFLGGEPIAFRSDLPEDDLGRTLANAGLIPEKQVNWIREKLGEGEALEQAIVMSGALTAAQITEHKQARLQTNIGSPLLWGSGDWQFHPHPELRVANIDPALRAEASTIAALWNAVGQHVSMDAVFPQVTDPKAGMVAMDPLCGALFPSLNVEEDFKGLLDVVGNGSSVEDIFRQIPDSTGNLVKLLWFLEAAGLVHREGRPQDATFDQQIEAAYSAPRPKPKPSKKTADAKPDTAATDSADDGGKPEEAGERKRRPPLTDDQLRSAHRKRMGRDFYAFLGLPSTAPKHAIDRKCKGLARRWRIPGKQRALEPDVQTKVDDLLAGVQLVWRTLTDDKHRSEYDKRMQQGRAPKVGDLRTAASSPQSSTGSGGRQASEPAVSNELQQARALMEKNQFKEALSVLKKARVDDPSSPDIMADLGWATWKLQGAKNGDAEEFLRLALTFDNNHLRGLEYLSKVLVEQNDIETAKVLLQRLTKLKPDSAWAKKALGNLSTGAR